MERQDWFISWELTTGGQVQAKGHAFIDSSNDKKASEVGTAFRKQLAEKINVPVDDVILVAFNRV